MVNAPNKDHTVSNAFTVQATIAPAKIFLLRYLIYLKLMILDSYSNLSILHQL